jgi:peptidoglycan/LPS O-acetylase OafA/YrhL
MFQNTAMETVIAAEDKTQSAVAHVAVPNAAGPDLLRAIAILLVMSWHLPRAARLESLEGLRQISWTGVDLFFVLSGYLIGTQLLKPIARGQVPGLREFYLKRSLRILPTFLAVLTIYVFVPALREVPDMKPAWRFLTFTMNFGLDFRQSSAFSHAWSLCVEEHFYLVLPATVLLLNRLRWRGWALLIAGLVLFGGMLLRAMLWLHVADATAGSAGEFGPIYMKEVYYPTYCRLDGLLFGVLLAAYRCFHPDHWRKYADPRAALLVGIGAIALASSMFHGTAPPLPGAVFGYPLFAFGFACLLSASLDWERCFGRWSVPGAGAIATISYSLYLSHKMTSHANPWLFDAQDLAGARGLFIYYGSSIAVAAVLWLTVERPFLLLRDRLLQRS